jgi:fido (protein-threonine AMPylation protein)
MAGGDAAAIARDTHKEWYRELFQPCVRAELIEPGALAGYRNMPVYLRTSRNVSPRWEAVRDVMPALFDLLEAEENSAVRSVLGHWMFGYIHPYPDGNRRMARFVMNVMLASDGYPWTVIRTEERDDYLNALDAASLDSDIKPFARFIGRNVRRSLRTKIASCAGHSTEGLEVLDIRERGNSEPSAAITYANTRICLLLFVTVFGVIWGCQRLEGAGNGWNEKQMRYSRGAALRAAPSRNMRRMMILVCSALS